MITIQKYVRPQTLEEAWQLNQNKRNRILGGMLWLRLGIEGYLKQPEQQQNRLQNRLHPEQEQKERMKRFPVTGFPLSAARFSSYSRNPSGRDSGYL